MVAKGARVLSSIVVNEKNQKGSSVLVPSPEISLLKILCIGPSPRGGVSNENYLNLYRSHLKVSILRNCESVKKYFVYMLQFIYKMSATISLSLKHLTHRQVLNEMISLWIVDTCCLRARYGVVGGQCNMADCRVNQLRHSFSFYG